MLFFCLCNSMFSTAPTVLAYFSTFSGNSLCHSLCLWTVKTAGIHGAILVNRDRSAMAHQRIGIVAPYRPTPTAVRSICVFCSSLSEHRRYIARACRCGVRRGGRADETWLNREHLQSVSKTGARCRRGTCTGAEVGLKIT